MNVFEELLDHSNLVLNWGATVTAGYILSFILSFNPLGLQYSPESQIVAMWFVVMSLPLGATVKYMVRERDYRNLNFIWGLVVFLGLMGNIYGISSISDQLILFISYYQKWFLLPAIMFAYTAYLSKGFFKKLYGVTAVLNAVFGLALFAFAELAVIAFPVAAVIQGMPMIVDWYRNR